MAEHRRDEDRPRREWGVRPDDRRIRAHLDRQRDVAIGWVRLDSGQIVPDGSDADGEDT